MRVNQKLAVLAVLVLAGAACKKDKPAPVPPFKPTPTPAVVPVNPTPAPTPRDVQVPPLDPLTQVRNMSIDEIDKMGLLGDVYYDFDKADLREADKATLVKNGEALKKFYFLSVTIEGHA